MKTEPGQNACRFSALIFPEIHRSARNRNQIGNSLGGDSTADITPTTSSNSTYTDCQLQTTDR